MFVLFVSFVEEATTIPVQFPRQLYFPREAVILNDKSNTSLFNNQK